MASFPKSAQRLRLACLSGALAPTAIPASAQVQKPNIILIVSDDFGYGDMGVYGGGENRGQPTPSLDRIANEGMQFLSFYGQPSCTPGRAAMHDRPDPQSQRHDDRLLPGPGRRPSGGGMDAGLGSEDRRLRHLLHRQMAPRRSRLRAAQRAGLRCDEIWRPLSSQRLHLRRSNLVPGHVARSFATCSTRSPRARCPATPARRAHEDFKINGQYVDTPDKGVVGIPFFDAVCREGVARLSRRARALRQAVLHERQFHEGAPAEHAGAGVPAQVDGEDQVCRFDRRERHPHRPDHGQDPVSLGLDKNTYVFWTTDNGAWQDVYPDAGYTPFRGTKGTVREGGARVPALAWGPGIKAGSKNSDIVGGLDYMATFASLAGVKLPENDREGKPIIFDSYDMSPILFGKGKSERPAWFYFTEDELSPGAVRVGRFKAVFNLRGDDGQATGGLAVDSNLGWKGASKYVATVPADLRSVAGPAGALRHLHEQLHRAHLDAGDVQCGRQDADADLRQISAAQGRRARPTPARSPSRPISGSSGCATSCSRKGSTFRCRQETERPRTSD